MRYPREWTECGLVDSGENDYNEITFILGRNAFYSRSGPFPVHDGRKCQLDPPEYWETVEK